MRAISDRSRSAIPAFGYPVPYAVSTVVFLIYGYLAMVLS
jgi:putative transport protein